MRAVTITSVVIAAVWTATGFVSAVPGSPVPQRFNALEHPAVRYYESEPTDSIAHLKQRVASGDIRMEAENEDDLLPALLDALDIDVSSQILVTSKTSLQLALISPATPRAIYFNDDTYIGWIQGSPLIEISTVDPRLGAVFYTIDVEEDRSGGVRFHRDFDVCMQCHNPEAPGHVMTSTVPDENGQPLFHAGTFVTTDRSPLEERWGGWYVTGTHGNQLHMGNLIVRDLPPSQPGLNFRRVELERAEGANVTDLTTVFDAEPYLSPHSDIVALMVLGHQVLVQNLMTKLHYAVAKSLYDRPGVDPVAANRDLAESFVDALLLVDEARLTSPVHGTSGFEEDFESRGPFDSQGRSLRALDLERRMFRYPLSYLIHSNAFSALPDAAAAFVYERIEQVLSGADRSPRFDHLSDADRQAIQEILIETQPGFARHLAER